MRSYAEMIASPLEIEKVYVPELAISKSPHEPEPFSKVGPMFPPSWPVN